MGTSSERKRQRQCKGNLNLSMPKEPKSAISEQAALLKCRPASNAQHEGWRHFQCAAASHLGQRRFSQQGLCQAEVHLPALDPAAWASQEGHRSRAGQKRSLLAPAKILECSIEELLKPEQGQPVPSTSFRLSCVQTMFLTPTLKNCDTNGVLRRVECGCNWRLPAETKSNTHLIGRVIDETSTSQSMTPRRSWMAVPWGTPEQPSRSKEPL